MTDESIAAEPDAWLWRCKPYCEWPKWSVSIRQQADSGCYGGPRTEGYEDIPLYRASPEVLRASSGSLISLDAVAAGPSGKAQDRSPRNTELSAEDIDYPRDLFDALIAGNSPYAFYLFQWVPYQTDAKRWRLKMLHDVKAFDGREALGIWPNGSSCGPFRDDEVEFIRISKKQWGAEWADPRKTSTEAA